MSDFNKYDKKNIKPGKFDVIQFCNNWKRENALSFGVFFSLKNVFECQSVSGKSLMQR